MLPTKEVEDRIEHQLRMINLYMHIALPLA